MSVAVLNVNLLVNAASSEFTVINACFSPGMWFIFSADVF